MDILVVDGYGGEIVLFSKGTPAAHSPIPDESLAITLGRNLCLFWLASDCVMGLS